MADKELVMELEEDISWLEQGCTTEKEICEHIKQAIKTIIQHKETENPWHTGTPTQNGLYLVCLIYCGDTYYLGMQFNDGVFDDSVYGFDWLKVDMLAWMPIEPFKEN